MQVKRIAAILTLLVLSQIGGAWMVYTTALLVHKQNKECRLLDVAKRVQIALSVSEYQSALVEEGEILFENKLYDVVSVLENGEKVLVTAVPDHAENKLKRTLNGLQNETSGWSEFANLASIFSITTFIQEPTLTFNRMSIEHILNHSCYSLTAKSQQHTDALERPPAV
jgi:hypothetical protein